METSKDLCRICLCVNANINLFNEEHIFRKLLEKFVICTAVMISVDDSLPKCICQVCVNKLNAAFRLREMAQDADKKLRERLENIKVEIEFDSLESANDESIVVKEECLLPESKTQSKTTVVEEEYLIPEIKIQSKTTVVKEEYLLPESKTQSNGDKKNERTEANKIHENTPIEKESNVKQRINKGNFTKLGPEHLKYCKFCNYTFKYQSSYKSHMDVEHKLQKLKQRTKSCKTHLLCDICGKTLHERTALTKHMKLHTGIRPFACNVCGKTFSLKGHMKRHVSCIHKKLKPYKCSICNKNFYQKYNLLNHQTTHTTHAALYSCKCCDRCYRHYHNLKAHVKKIHPDQPVFKLSDYCVKRDSK